MCCPIRIRARKDWPQGASWPPLVTSARSPFSRCMTLTLSKMPALRRTASKSCSSPGPWVWILSFGRYRPLRHTLQPHAPFQCGVETYLHNWRMQLGIAAIALRVGYESEEALNRVFKQGMGKPPAQWRAPRAKPRFRAPEAGARATHDPRRAGWSVPQRAGPPPRRSQTDARYWDCGPILENCWT